MTAIPTCCTLSVLFFACVAATPADEPVEDPARQSLKALIWEQLDPAAPKVGFLRDPALRWLEANKPFLTGIRTSGLVLQPWGMTALRPAGEGRPAVLYLYVFDWHASGKLVVYGLTGGVRRAYVSSDPKQADLPVHWMGKSGTITVPKEPPDSLATVVVLELTEQFKTTDIVSRPVDGGRIVLAARDAVVYGRTLRFEPEPHKDTLGYWMEPRDYATWQFEVVEPGEYAAAILQGCGKGSGGSKVDFGVGEQVLKVTVQDTGGFQNFVTRDIGRYRFDAPGRYTLTVKPVEKPGAAVMDLRQVTLTRLRS